MQNAFRTKNFKVAIVLPKWPRNPRAMSLAANACSCNSSFITQVVCEPEFTTQWQETKALIISDAQSHMLALVHCKKHDSFNQLQFSLIWRYAYSLQPYTNLRWTTLLTMLEYARCMHQSWPQDWKCMHQNKT